MTEELLESYDVARMSGVERDGERGAQSVDVGRHSRAGCDELRGFWDQVGVLTGPEPVLLGLA